MTYFLFIRDMLLPRWSLRCAHRPRLYPASVFQSRFQVTYPRSRKVRIQPRDAPMNDRATAVSTDALVNPSSGKPWYISQNVSQDKQAPEAYLWGTREHWGGEPWSIYIDPSSIPVRYLLCGHVLLLIRSSKLTAKGLGIFSATDLESRNTCQIDSLGPIARFKITSQSFQ